MANKTIWTTFYESLWLIECFVVVVIVVFVVVVAKSTLLSLLFLNLFTPLTFK